MVQRKKPMFTLVAVGDVAPCREDPPSIFSYCGDVFKKADIVFGQMESPLVDECRPTVKDPYFMPTKNVSALTEEGAGFDVMSIACNHAMHCGYEGFASWLALLKKNNITTVGGGENITAARKPAIIERQGVKVGFLAYLSVSRAEISFADPDRAGCAPLRASHYNDQVEPWPGTPPIVVTKLFPEDRKAMEEDIRKLRPQVDVLVVSIHCGVLHLKGLIAMYQKEAAYAAIDAGADMVLQHHPHIMRGVEVYKGKSIFYSMGTFAAEHWLFKDGTVNESPRKIALHRDFYHIKPVPGYEKWHYPYDALKTMVVKAYIQDKKIQKVTYLPAYIKPTFEPEVLTRKDPRAQEVFDYVKEISESQDLKVNFSWEGDEVLINKGE